LAIERNEIRKVFKEIHTYLTTTSTVGCSMRKKERDI
jgi:hypothetical protein